MNKKGIIIHWADSQEFILLDNNNPESAEAITTSKEMYKLATYEYQIQPRARKTSTGDYEITIAYEKSIIGR